MSAINKQPFIHKVIATLTKSNLTSLQALLNGAETTIFRSYLNSNYAFTTDDKGIRHCVFEAENEVFTGYLIYNNSYCVLVAYKENSQELKEIKIDYANKKYTIIDEELDINEFRRLVDNSKTDLVVELNDVVANPTLAGTEDILTGITIDGTKYKVDALPTYPETIEDKTYVLKLVSGVLTWVEEV